MYIIVYIGCVYTCTCIYLCIYTHTHCLGQYLLFVQCKEIKCLGHLMLKVLGGFTVLTETNFT